MKPLLIAVIVAGLVPQVALAATGETTARPIIVAQAAPKDSATKDTAVKDTAPPKVVDVKAVTVRGTVEAIDKEKKTVTLKGPKRSLTMDVNDPSKLDAIKVGDPVIAKYYEALALEVKKPGEATPSVSAQGATATSKPGETPAGAVGREIKATVTVTAIDKKAQTVTVKGPSGGVETVKARDPKNLDKLKVGDLIEITYTQALAIALDKPAAKSK